MSAREYPSRRLILRHALALSALGLAAAHASRAFAQRALPTPQCRDHDEPTEEQIEGPFFKPRSPQRDDLVEPQTRGQIFEVTGMVLTRSCRPVAGALLDLWHANETGDYDNSGFRYRGHILSDAAGRYRFRTIRPGLYPGRTRHYHFKLQAPRTPLLTTQLYFPNEPRNARDDFFSPELLMRIAESPAPATGRFDFVLDIA